MKNIQLELSRLFGSQKNALWLAPLILLGWLVVVLGKDLLHAAARDYAFYWYESALFGSIWLWFLPLLVVQYWLSQGGRRTIYYLWMPVVFCLLHLLVFSFTVFAISHLFFRFPFPFGGTLVEALADYSLSGLVIYGLGAVLFRLSPKKETQEGEKQRIKLRHRGTMVLITPESIHYIQTERPYLAITTGEQTYLKQASLRQFKADHLPGNFIQIHRSTVINTDFIHSFQSRKNGDYDVRMVDGITLRVSRRYNTYFRS